jgi:hypothetical protein
MQGGKWMPGRAGMTESLAECRKISPAMTAGIFSCNSLMGITPF